MRIYQSAIEAADELARELKEMGIVYQSDTVQDKYVGNDPDFETLELMAYTYCLSRYDDIEQLLPHMNMPVDWVKAEMVERLDLGLINKNPGTAWLLREELWSEYLRNGSFSYTYPERWHAQIPFIIRELTERPNTRQAIMTMYETTRDMMNWGGQDRVPCSLSYQFFIRNNKVHLVYTQRSCDFNLFYASDVYTSVKLLEYIAIAVNLEPGNFYHSIGSLHVFKKHVKDQF